MINFDSSISNIALCIIMANNIKKLNYVEILLDPKSNVNDLDKAINGLIVDYELHLKHIDLAKVFQKLNKTSRKKEIDFVIVTSFNEHIDLFKAIIISINAGMPIFDLTYLISYNVKCNKLLHMNYYENPFNSIWIRLYDFHEYDILHFCTRLFHKRVIQEYVNEKKSGKRTKNAIKSQ